MGSESEGSDYKHIKTLNKASDFIQWKRHMYYILRREDPTLIGVTSRPNDGNEKEKNE